MAPLGVRWVELPSHVKGHLIDNNPLEGHCPNYTEHGGIRRIHDNATLRSTAQNKMHVG